MKEGVECFVDHYQPEAAMTVFKEKAKSIGAEGLYVVPKLEEYDWGRLPKGVLGLKGEEEFVQTE